MQPDSNRFCRHWPDDCPPGRITRVRITFNFQLASRVRRNCCVRQTVQSNRRGYTLRFTKAADRKVVSHLQLAILQKHCFLKHIEEPDECAKGPEARKGELKNLAI